MNGITLLSGTGEYTDQLHYTEVVVTDPDLCEELLQDKNPTWEITDSMICAGDDDFFEKDTCQVIYSETSIIQ